MADDPARCSGAWSLNGDQKYAVTLRTALAERLVDRLFYAKGCELLSGSDSNRIKRTRINVPNLEDDHAPVPDDLKTISEAVETAKKADLVIVALGENTEWMEGEAASRTKLNFTGAQEQLLEAVTAVGKPVVLSCSPRVRLNSSGRQRTSRHSPCLESRL